MKDEVKLPRLGEDASGGTVLRVLVGEGDHVEVDQSIVEIESDKATVEVPSPSQGVVSALAVAEGDEVAEGDVLLTLETSRTEAADGADEEPAGEEEPSAEEQEPEPEHEPEQEQSAEEQEQEQERDPTGTLEEVEPSQDQESVEEEQPVADEQPEEDHEQPVADEQPEEDDERPAADEQPEEDDEQARATEARRRPAAPREGARRAAPPRGPAPSPASPSTRRLARELGVDLAQVVGTGAGGRVEVEDLHSHVRWRLSQTPASPELPDLERFGPVRRERLSPVRRATARALSRSWERIPHVTQADEADIGALETSRRALSEELEREGHPPLTLTAVVARALCGVLLGMPRFNAALDERREELVVREDVHLGVAVDTEAGLLVPVIRHAAGKGLATLSIELQDLARRARQRKLRPEELAGASFTLSNLGGLGTTWFSPLVTWPQVAILGVSRARRQPGLEDGQRSTRLVLPLCLSYDHRVIDGADAARFLRRLARSLEEPLRLSL